MAGKLIEKLDADEFYNRVKFLVKEKGITINTMMKECFGEGSNNFIYQGWRRRGIFPRADIAFVIANYLGVSVEYLLQGKEAKESPISPIETKLYCDLEALLKKYKSI